MKTKSLIIVGAGAHVPYGFPTGAGLKNEIKKLKTGDYEVLSDNRFKKINNLAELLFEKKTFKLQNLDEARDLIKALVDSFLKSQSTTIDTFLSRMPIFERIGKIIISYLIRDKELENEIGYHEEDDWIQLLLNSHFNRKEDVETNISHFPTIITFNYDRHLEMSIYEYLKHNFEYSAMEATNLINNHFNIIHVYGQLGGTYEASLLFEKEGKGILEDYKFIKTIRDGQTVDKQIQKEIESANTIYILGFGFDKINFELLFGTFKWEYDISSKIYATGYGLAYDSLSWIKKKTQNKIIFLKDETKSEFLKTREFMKRIYKS